MPEKQRILILAEGATLAHPTRCACLAELLATDGFDVFYGTSLNYLPYVGKIPGVQLIEITSPSTQEVLIRLDSGKFSHTTDDLEIQLSENTQIIKDLKPAWAIGDVRMTLPMACKLSGIPCITLINHHWSPYVRSTYPVPDSAPARLFGKRLSNLLSRFVTPILLKKAIKPLNKVRAQHGFTPYQTIRDAYCDGDYVLYVGLPRQAQSNFPRHHLMVGPLIWHGRSSGSQKPIKKLNIQSNKPIIFISLGSSGDHSLVPRIIKSLASFQGTLLVAHPEPHAIEALGLNHVIVRPFIPIADALDVADLMIGNGGTATILAALVAGKPYLALYTNLDQALSFEQYRLTGAVNGGLSTLMTPEKILRVVEDMLHTTAAADAARRCRDEFIELGGDAWTINQMRHILNSGPPEYKP